LAPPIKPITHFTQVAAPWPWWGSPAVWISNKSFPHMAWSSFGSTLYI
jgi:hypothetical protein